MRCVRNLAVVCGGTAAPYAGCMSRETASAAVALRRLSRGRRAAVSAAGAAALALPILLWTLFISFGSLRHGYDLLSAATSTLAARGTPHAQLFTILFFYLGGGMTAAAGAGCLAVSGSRTLWKIGSLLVVIAGALLVLTGYFPTAGAGARTATIHQDVSQACFAAIAFAPLLLRAGAPRGAVSHVLSAVWIAGGIATLVVEFGFAAVNWHFHLPFGYFQRPFLASVSLSFWAVGTWLVLHRHEHVEPMSQESAFI